MEEHYTTLLGFIPAGFFLAMVFFAAVGVTIALLVDSTRRNKTSKNTPEKFNFWFLILDNWKTILLTCLLILVTIRFAGSLFPQQFIDSDLSSATGKEKWLFGSLLIGFSFNSLLQIIKQKSSFLKAKRDQ